MGGSLTCHEVVNWGTGACFSSPLPLPPLYFFIPLPFSERPAVKIPINPFPGLFHLTVCVCKGTKHEGRSCHGSFTFLQSWGGRVDGGGEGGGRAQQSDCTASEEAKSRTSAALALHFFFFQFSIFSCLKFQFWSLKRFFFSFVQHLRILLSVSDHPHQQQCIF